MTTAFVPATAVAQSYIKNSCGAHSYFGSNATLSKDLGVSVRTIQHRLKKLSDVGFIESVIDNYYDRNIYINYERIFAEITKNLIPDFNSFENIMLCQKVVERFVSSNFLERSKSKEYILFLRIQYLLETSKQKISNPVKFLYETLANKLELNFEVVRKDYEMAKLEYIKKINAKSE